MALGAVGPGHPLASGTRPHAASAGCLRDAGLKAPPGFSTYAAYAGSDLVAENGVVHNLDPRGPPCFRVDCSGKTHAARGGDNPFEKRSLSVHMNLAMDIMCVVIGPSKDAYM